MPLAGNFSSPTPPRYMLILIFTPVESDRLNHRVSNACDFENSFLREVTCKTLNCLIGHGLDTPGPSLSYAIHNLVLNMTIIHLQRAPDCCCDVCGLPSEFDLVTIFLC
jgi:hypothetical protein